MRTPQLCTGWTCRGLVVALALTPGFAPSHAADEPLDYARDLKPILKARCFACHGALKQEAGLRLDSGTWILKGGENGPVVAAGKPAESELLARVVTQDLAARMPPADEGDGLTPAQQTAFRRWIEAGAKFPANDPPEPDPRDHWAFRPLVRPALPPGGPASVNPIDAFLARAQAEGGLAPQPAAPRGVWLRRVYLDLIGLPPSLEELDAFERDDAPGAQGRVVERLLSDPAYGERWGRHWMDIWRFSDWWGLGAEVRNSQKHIRHWRDWIVESLNADLGYDEMVRQMLAADELYPNDLGKLRATGYLARQYFKFNRNSWLDETVEHTSKAFLGLTFNCAKCHDHKYDPLSQVDYYRFRAFFEPYQVRTEILPGETDLEKDGLPRAFDCNLDAPTYLFQRGDEKRPLKERPLAPGLPPLLAFEELRIEPVTLPIEAVWPGLRLHVLETHLAQVATQVAAAEQALAEARRARQAAERAAALAPPAPATPTPPKESPLDPLDPVKPLWRDDFAAAKPDLWQTVSGAWKHENGRLRQSMDGATRAVLRAKQAPPLDFQVRFKFITLGGQQWKSVGVAFDVAENREAMVYLSAVQGGSKVQVTYKQGANFVYPPEAAQMRAVPLGKPQELLIRARGPLLNVSVNGEPALAYRLPIARQPGALDLVTFDAQAEFLEFELSALPATVKLVEAVVPAPGSTGTGPSAAPAGPPTVPQAVAGEALAEKRLAAAKQQADLWRARAAADAARLASPPAETAPALVREAARQEKAAVRLKAAEDAARAELDLARAEGAKRAEAEKKVAAAREALAKAEQAEASPGESYTSLRGAVKTAENNLEGDASRLKPFPAASTGRRTALARWMTDRRNPLTARVAVNHIWSRHFGQPLVPVVFDFGRRSPAPRHVELLDWLASELVENGWSMKRLHRLVCASEAYRRSSSARNAAPQNGERDPENVLLWRMPTQRMSSQMVRDGLLSLSGTLDRTLGGPSIPAGQASNRRSLYFVHSHNDHQKFLSMFDDASVLECYRRTESIVPQQALTLSNSREAWQSAEGITGRLEPAAPADDDETFVRQAFRLVLASPPTAEEAAACREALAAFAGPTPSPESRRRARISLVHALLNHNDFVTIR